MKIQTDIRMFTFKSDYDDEQIRDEINHELELLEISSDNLIDIKINVAPVYNVIVDHKEFDWDELTSNEDFDAIPVKYVVTIIYKTED